jgi:hypothetical protein
MKKKIFAMLCVATMMSMLTACGTTPTVDNDNDDEIVDVVDNDDEIVDVVDNDDEIVDVVDNDDEIAYINETCTIWSDDTGIAFMFEKGDGQFDIITFKADLVRDGGEATVNKAFEGASFTATLDVENMQSAPGTEYFGITDKNFNLIVWVAYDESDALTIDTNTIMGTADKYQEMSDGHFVIAYTNAIGEDVAQEVLNSCVYYDNGVDVAKQLKTMEDSVK